MTKPYLSICLICVLAWIPAHLSHAQILEPKDEYEACRKAHGGRCNAEPMDLEVYMRVKYDCLCRIAITTGGNMDFGPHIAGKGIALPTMPTKSITFTANPDPFPFCFEKEVSLSYEVDQPTGAGAPQLTPEKGGPVAGVGESVFLTWTGRWTGGENALPATYIATIRATATCTP